MTKFFTRFGPGLGQDFGQVLGQDFGQVLGEDLSQVLGQDFGQTEQQRQQPGRKQSRGARASRARAPLVLRPFGVPGPLFDHFCFWAL